MLFQTDPSLFSTIFKIITFGSLISLWWDGENKYPYIVIEGEENKSMIYSGYALTNWDNQYNSLVRFTFEELQIYQPNTRINISSIDEGASYGYYYYDSNGCSMVVDRLILTDPETGDGLFVAFDLHVVGTPGNLYHLLKYRTYEIVVPQDDEDSGGI
jgi:hypothetical protein